MRLTEKESVNSAIKKICGKSTMAGTVIVTLQREYPERVLSLLRDMDRNGIYEGAIPELYMKCGSDIVRFVEEINR